jgi:hypothetical protein
LFAGLGLAGCQQTATAPAPETAASSVPVPALASVESLAGEWRVAGIDGQSLDERYGIALSGDADELWWEPRCAGMLRRYRITGTAVSFGPAGEAAKLAPGSPPPPVCTIAIPSRLPDVARALDSATSVGRTPANGVQIAGGGHSVLLFSQ